MAAQGATGGRARRRRRADRAGARAQGQLEPLRPRRGTDHGSLQATGPSSAPRSRRTYEPGSAWFRPPTGTCRHDERAVYPRRRAGRADGRVAEHDQEVHAEGMPSETWGMGHTRRYLASEAITWARERDDTIRRVNTPSNGARTPLGTNREGERWLISSLGEMARTRAPPPHRQAGRPSRRDRRADDVPDQARGRARRGRRARRAARPR